MSSSRDQTTLFHTPSFGDEDFVDLSSALPFVDSFDPVGAGALLAPAAPHQLNFNNQDIDSVSSGDYFNQSYFSEYHQPIDHPLATAEFTSPFAYPLINQTTSDFQQFQGLYQPQHATLAGAPHQSFTMESNLLSDESDDSFRRFSSASDPSTFDQLKDPKKRKKRDTPNEPQKPVSAYALFFRDTQTAIKDQNPDTSFGEVSKIVSSMWDALDVEHKNVYKKKAENAKKEYLRQLAEYRAHAVSKGEDVSIHQSVAMQDSGIGENLMVSSRNSSIIMKGGGSQSPKGVIIQRITGNSTLSSPRSDHMMQQNSLDGGIGHNSSSDQQAEMEREASGDGSAVLQKCIRTGCPNEAIVNPDWEDEYCSNECVIIHCRDVFSKWVQTNSLQQESY